MMKISELPRVWRTVRHLRLSQIAKRVERTASLRWRSLLPPRGGTRKGFGSSEFAEEISFATRRLPDIPLTQISESDEHSFIEQLQQGRFSHLHQTEELGFASPDWRFGNPASGRLWTITLHYHDWVYRLAQIIHEGGGRSKIASELLEHYLGDWLRESGTEANRTENLAWNAYAIATRLPRWFRAYELIQDSFFAQRMAFKKKFLASAYAQTKHLAANLEWDLRANHLLRDAVGLAWAGRFFGGDEAQGWLERAASLGLQQAREQVLADGGHFERSPHYHVEVMHDLSSLIMLIDDEKVVEELRAKWRGMAEYLCWLRHPDGCCPQFNDSASTHADDVLKLGSRIACAGNNVPRTGVRHFEKTGMVVWHGSPWSVFFDVGEVGPDYQPGHAHADTCSLECSLAGQRLFVDPGCHSYDQDERRRYDRSTAAHNTVCVDGADSSEVWHIFRVGRRARPRQVEVTFNAGEWIAHAGHDGYDHLPGRPRHERTVRGKDFAALEIQDVIKGSGPHVVEGGFLLSPEWHVESLSEGWRVVSNQTRAVVFLDSNRAVARTVQRRPFHPDYGRDEVTNRLCWSYQGELPLRVTTRIQSL